MASTRTQWILPYYPGAPGRRLVPTKKRCISQMLDAKIEPPAAQQTLPMEHVWVAPQHFSQDALDS